LKTTILLGIIAVTILGTMSVQNIFVQAGLSPIETIQVDGTEINVGIGSSATSSAQCPALHPFLIGGSYKLGAGDNVNFQVIPTFNTITNTYEVEGLTSSGGDSITIQARALCANFNFPMMGMAIGGELINIDTVSLLVSAIGVNPVITAIVGITLAGVAGQAAWFIHRRKKKNSS